MLNWFVVRIPDVLVLIGYMIFFVWGVRTLDRITASNPIASGTVPPTIPLEQQIGFLNTSPQALFDKHR